MMCGSLAGGKLGFVYMHVCDECAGGGGMCNEIDLVVLCVKWVLRCLSQMLCQRKDKLSALLYFRSECEAIWEQVLEAHDVFAIEEGERGEVRGEA